MKGSVRGRRGEAGGGKGGGGVGVAAALCFLMTPAFVGIFAARPFLFCR